MTTHRINLYGHDLKGTDLYIDQVHIIFRPSSEITVFDAGDDATKPWRAESSQLLIRTTPGERHLLLATPSTYNTHEDTVRSPVAPITYSSALCVTPDAEGAEDMWCRTYRPVRDMPVARNVFSLTDLSIELIFPLLLEDSRTTLKQIPNYRIIKVLCEFSLDK